MKGQFAIFSDHSAGNREVAVSVAIPTYNAETHLEAAIRSALNQTVSDLEVIIVDDASTDGTVALARRLAREDSRVRVEQLLQNGGPSVARNRAIEMANGRWFAILDSDDLLGHDRLRQLTTEGQAFSADMVADNLIVFDGDVTSDAHFFLSEDRCSGWLDLESYLRGTMMYSQEPSLGYLKPIMRTNSLKQAKLRYNPSLRIAEDDDLIVRALLSGMRYRLSPTAGYAYRRHIGSTSHRLSADKAAAIAFAGRQMLDHAPSMPMSLRVLFARRAQAFDRAAAFAKLIEALKGRRWIASGVEIARNPSIIPLLRMPVGAAIGRWRGKVPQNGFREPDHKALALLSAILNAV